ncbi:MAG: hypothetical protein IT440_08485 [Phycisphaeraceae bacterium]|nr:hypothetical protein [Phycisphaeraceae bacterium]
MAVLSFAQQEPAPAPGSAPGNAPGSAPGRDPESTSASDPGEDRDLALTLLPWGVSILLHAGIILLAVFIVWSVRQQIDEEEIIIPIARLSATPGTPLKMTQTRQLTKMTTSTSRVALTARAVSQAQTALASKVSTEPLALATQMQSSSADLFDAGVAAGSGLTVRFFSTGGNAKRIIYLVDASGSLIDTLPFVLLELKKSIGNLSEKQSYTVIFFQGDRAIEVPPAGLKQAGSASRQKTYEWLDGGNIIPMGLSNPVKALQVALLYKPQLLFILSDNITGEGRYEVDQRKLLEDIRGANKGGTHINTYQFLYQDKLVDYGMKPTLQLISEESGGIYTFIDGRTRGIE